MARINDPGHSARKGKKMATYPTQKAVASDRNIGSVTGRSVTQYSFDVAIEPMDNYDAVANEYLITVNGRVVKRMNEYQAKRMGLIRLCGYSQRI